MAIQHCDAAELGGLLQSRVGGSFWQVLICVMAKFRSPPNPLIAALNCYKHRMATKGERQSNVVTGFAEAEVSHESEKFGLRSHNHKIRIFGWKIVV